MENRSGCGENLKKSTLVLFDLVQTDESVDIKFIDILSKMTPFNTPNDVVFNFGLIFLPVFSSSSF